jgi:hypothetical protein
MLLPLPPKSTSLTTKSTTLVDSLIGGKEGLFSNSNKDDSMPRQTSDFATPIASLRFPDINQSPYNKNSVYFGSAAGGSSHAPNDSTTKVKGLVEYLALNKRLKSAGLSLAVAYDAEQMYNILREGQQLFEGGYSSIDSAHSDERNLSNYENIEL